MRYIKKFEGYTFGVGDYVLLDLDKLKELEKEDSIKSGLYDKDDDELQDDFKYAQIYFKFITRESPFRVKFHTGRVYDVDYDIILRLLNQYEIDSYESKKSANKYNL